MQATQDVITVESATIGCDGGGGPLGHPKVYLSFGKTSEVVCPYCNRRYKLAEGAKADHGH
ncbi:MAG: zinc-finger domain-containing protein [Rhodospirillales bacterium]|nr:zinc-finger domain-containing protein [Rhodospirillales bacterium]